MLSKYLKSIRKRKIFTYKEYKSTMSVYKSMFETNASMLNLKKCNCVICSKEVGILETVIYNEQFYCKDCFEEENEFHRMN